MILKRITVNKLERNNEMQGWIHYKRFTIITIYYIKLQRPFVCVCVCMSVCLSVCLSVPPFFDTTVEPRSNLARMRIDLVNIRT